MVTNKGILRGEIDGAISGRTIFPEVRGYINREEPEVAMPQNVDL